MNSTYEKANRPELEIINDLKSLCILPGYANCLAMLCLKSNLILYEDALTPDALNRLNASDRLLRSELDLLTGFLIQGTPDDIVPNDAVLAEYVKQTHQLLLELHHATQTPFRDSMKNALKTSDFGSVLSTGSMLKEAMFYAGEAAYPFQFREFAQLRYAADRNWLENEFGFNIAEAAEFVAALDKYQLQRIEDYRNRFQENSAFAGAFLSIFEIAAGDVSKNCSLSERKIDKIVSAFCISGFPCNTTFNEIGDFNEATAKPIVRIGDKYYAFQTHAIAASMYESPFYWMLEDEYYKNISNIHRGEFTEEFIASRLRSILGTKRIFRNVTFTDHSGKRVGEIDVLAIYADRAILVQAKSKRLTLAARKGDDAAIRGDFKAAVQDAYDQAVRCAQYLENRNMNIIDSDGTKIDLRREYAEIFPLCVVSDNYPALALQASLFLDSKDSPHLRHPYVVDVFFIDALCEFLSSPLHLFNFLHHRMNYLGRVWSNSEMAVLSYHLAHNLRFDNEIGYIDIGEDFSVHLDSAMLVRREGVPGERTPTGILTKLNGTFFETLIGEIGACEGDRILELGYHLLQMNEDTARELSEACLYLLNRTENGRHLSDVTRLFGDEGLTIHTTVAPDSEMQDRLRTHCEMKKYQCKARRWFGVALTPDRRPHLRLAMGLDYEWQHSQDFDLAFAQMPQSIGHSSMKKAIRSVSQKNRKVGRNDPCPCGSGKKFKKCCNKQTR